ncbi:C-C motif chemokine 25 [Suncus etruscus]|uniref:C-C motif chemokine 25 n=1 Tax=Suncus etruscus TaxID=109475 RepID=UPI002110AE86|nr:C-C motif chemokine 25 [Suncus etruscus]
MSVWFLGILLLGILGVWDPAVNAQGAFEDCCLSYHHRARLTQFRHAKGYTLQHVSGGCNLPAVIFYLPQKILCGHPRAKWVQKGMRFLDHRKRVQGHHIGPRKLNLSNTRPKVHIVNSERVSLDPILAEKLEKG